MQARLFERIAAYLIDLVIISIITVLITSSMNNNTKDYDKELDTIMKDYQVGEISRVEFVNKYETIVYESSKDNYDKSIVALLISIAYFIVFTYLNKGKTIGKSILGIRIVDKNTKQPPKIINTIIRNIIPFGILSQLVSLILITIVNKNTYINIYVIVTCIELLTIVASIIMISLKKYGYGLHDKIAGTIVVKEERRWYNA